MRIASFNVENLFERARVMNRELWAGTDGSSNARWAAGRQPLEDYAALNALLNQPVYSAADKKKIIALLTRLGLAKSDESQLVILRRNRGALLKRPRSGGIKICLGTTLATMRRPRNRLGVTDHSFVAGNRRVSTRW